MSRRGETPADGWRLAPFTARHQDESRLARLEILRELELTDTERMLRETFRGY